jgi:hypothetical protein
VRKGPTAQGRRAQYRYRNSQVCYYIETDKHRTDNRQKDHDDAYRESEREEQDSEVEKAIRKRSGADVVTFSE